MATGRPNINTAMIQELQKEVLELSAQWSVMKNEWSDMKDQVHNSEHKIDRILHILEKDEAIGSEGLVHEVRKNSEFRDKSLTHIKLIALIISTAVSLGFVLIKEGLFK